MTEASSAMQKRFATLVVAFAETPNVSVGQKGKKGFGSSALQVNGKIFAMLSAAGDFVVKLPRQRVEELVANGAGQQFDPGHGRLMKEWLVVHSTTRQAWLDLAREALGYVGT
jgi:hypothetical protein